MEELSVVLFVISFATMLVYAYKCVGSTISLTLILFMGLLAIHGIPLLVYLYITGPDTLIYEAALANVASPESVRSNLLLSVSLMFIGVVAGSEIGRRFSIRETPSILVNKIRHGVFNSNRVVRIMSVQRVVLWIVVFAMLAISIEQSQLSKISQFFISANSDMDRAILRHEEGGTPYYLYNVLLYSVAPFLVMVSWADHMRRSPNSWQPGLLTLSMFWVTLIGKIATLSKAPPAIFLLQLGLMFVLMTKDRISVSLLVKFVAALILTFGLMVYLNYDDAGLSTVIEYLYYRIFDIPNEVLLEYFAAIPNIIPHTWGRAVFAWFGLVPMVDNTLDTYFAVAEITRGSIDSSSNAMFIGDAWATFAWAGVMVTSLLVGLVVRMFDHISNAFGRSDLKACMIPAGAFGVLTALSTSFSTSLVTGGLILIPFVALAFIDWRGLFFSARLGSKKINCLNTSKAS